MSTNTLSDKELKQLDSAFAANLRTPSTAPAIMKKLVAMVTGFSKRIEQLESEVASLKAAKTPAKGSPPSTATSSPAKGKDLDNI